MRLVHWRSSIVKNTAESRFNGFEQIVGECFGAFSTRMMRRKRDGGGYTGRIDALDRVHQFELRNVDLLVAISSFVESIRRSFIAAATEWLVTKPYAGSHDSRRGLCLAPLRGLPLDR